MEIGLKENKKVTLSKTSTITKYRLPLLVGLVLSIICVSVFGAVIIGSWLVTLDVQEALSVTNVDRTINAFPNGDYVEAVTIDNVGDADVTAEVTITEISNPDAVVYSLSYDTNPVVVPAGGSANVDATIHVDNGSPIGQVEIRFEVNRPDE